MSYFQTTDLVEATLTTVENMKLSQELVLFLTMFGYWDICFTLSLLYDFCILSIDSFTGLTAVFDLIYGECVNFDFIYRERNRETV